jgi:hypothetical protein
VSSHNKNFNKFSIEGTYLNTMKVTYDKPTVNIILSGKKGIVSSKIRNNLRPPALTTPVQQSSKS